MLEALSPCFPLEHCVHSASGALSPSDVRPEHPDNAGKTRSQVMTDT